MGVEILKILRGLMGVFLPPAAVRVARSLLRPPRAGGSLRPHAQAPRTPSLRGVDGEDAVGGQGDGDGVPVGEVRQLEATDEAQTRHSGCLLLLRLSLHHQLLAVHELHRYVPAGEVIHVYHDLYEEGVIMRMLINIHNPYLLNNYLGLQDYEHE